MANIISGADSAGNPCTFDPSCLTAKDQIRARIGDTDGAPQWFLADATVLYLATNFALEEAQARGCEMIAALCAQLAVRVIQRSLQVYYADRAAEMINLAKQIRTMASPDPSAPVNYGAISGASVSRAADHYRRDVSDWPERCEGNQPYDPLFGEGGGNW